MGNLRLIKTISWSRNVSGLSTLSQRARSLNNNESQAELFTLPARMYSCCDVEAELPVEPKLPSPSPWLMPVFMLDLQGFYRNVERGENCTKTCLYKKNTNITQGRIMKSIRFFQTSFRFYSLRVVKLFFSLLFSCSCVFRDMSNDLQCWICISAGRPMEFVCCFAGLLWLFYTELGSLVRPIV